MPSPCSPGAELADSLEGGCGRLGLAALAPVAQSWSWHLSGNPPTPGQCPSAPVCSLWALPRVASWSWSPDSHRETDLSLPAPPCTPSLPGSLWRKHVLPQGPWPTWPPLLGWGLVGWSITPVASSRWSQKSEEADYKYETHHQVQRQSCWWNQNGQVIAEAKDRERNEVRKGERVPGTFAGSSAWSCLLLGAGMRGSVYVNGSG